jgi:hypothetical protein
VIGRQRRLLMLIIWWLLVVVAVDTLGVAAVLVATALILTFLLQLPQLMQSL